MTNTKCTLCGGPVTVQDKQIEVMREALNAILYKDCCIPTVCEEALTKCNELFDNLEQLENDELNLKIESEAYLG